MVRSYLGRGPTLVLGERPFMNLEIGNRIGSNFEIAVPCDSSAASGVESERGVRRTVSDLLSRPHRLARLARG